MPVRWTIAHAERLVTVRAEGPVALKAIEAYFDDLVVSNAMPYRKLFDARGVEPQLSDADMMLLGARVSAYAAMDPRGPIAVVVNSDAAFAVVSRFANLGNARRSLKIFEAIDEARLWLDLQPAVT